MTEERPGKRTVRQGRLWVVPPGLMASDEPFEGYRVLEEVRSELGLTLWQFARDADLWSTTAPDRRPRLFPARRIRRLWQRTAELGGARELRLPLENLGRALLGRSRESGEQLTRACEDVSRWAEDHGLPRTALAFAQSAALAAPDQPAAAFAVGVLARRNAEYRRAETWFRRALGLARRASDWRYYGMACLGIGALYRQRGDYRTARSWYVRAHRFARRYALWDVRPLALHDLFSVAANGGRHDEAQSLAESAFKAYGPRHPRLLTLAHDVARYWLRCGRYEESLRVFRAVLPHIGRTAEKRLVTSSMARAAAELADRLTFAAMWAETWRLVDEFEDREAVAQALIALAEGAAVLGDPDRGQVAASHALRVAIQRNESEQRLAAEQVLLSLRTVRMGVATAKPHPEPPEARTGPDFADDLVDALRVDFAATLAAV